MGIVESLRNDFSCRPADYRTSCAVNNYDQASSLPVFDFGINPMCNPSIGQGMLGLSPLNPMGFTGAGVNQYIYDPNVRELAEIVNSSLNKAPILGGHKRVKSILSNLANDNPEKLAALELVYGQMYGEPDKLRKDLRSHSTGINCGLFRITYPFSLAKPQCEEINILNQAAKVSPMNAAIALHEAMKGIGTDEKTVNDIIGNSSDQTLSYTMQYYKTVSGGESLHEHIENDFVGAPQEHLASKLDRALIRAY